MLGRPLKKNKNKNKKWRIKKTTLKRLIILKELYIFKNPMVIFKTNAWKNVKIKN